MPCPSHPTMFSPCNRKGFRDRTNEGDTHEPSKSGLWISLGPGSAVWEKGEKRGEIEKISASEASRAVA